MSSLTAFLVAWAISMAIPVAARAQTSDQKTPDTDGDASPAFVARWNNGITIESDDEKFKLQLGALVQADGRFVPAGKVPPSSDTFLMRRVRPIIQGRVAEYFEFRLMPDFAGSNVVLFDAYIDTKFSERFRVRVGKDKTPIGLEQLYADYSLLFPERTLASNLVPNRDV